VENLASFQPFVGQERTVIGVVDKIAIALAEGVVDFAQHGAERTGAVAAKPETHRIEHLAQHARECHQHRLAVANVRKTMSSQHAAQPGREITCACRIPHPAVYVMKSAEHRPRDDLAVPLHGPMARRNLG